MFGCIKSNNLLENNLVQVFTCIENTAKAWKDYGMNYNKVFLIEFGSLLFTNPDEIKEWLSRDFPKVAEKMKQVFYQLPSFVQEIIQLIKPKISSFEFPRNDDSKFDPEKQTPKIRYFPKTEPETPGRLLNCAHKFPLIAGHSYEQQKRATSFAACIDPAFSDLSMRSKKAIRDLIKVNSIYTHPDKIQQRLGFKGKILDEAKDVHAQLNEWSTYLKK